MHLRAGPYGCGSTERERRFWTPFAESLLDGQEGGSCDAMKALGLYHDRVVPHLVNLGMRSRHLTPYRQRVVALAEGRVLEIGSGSGLNFPLYSNRATQVVGLERHPRLVEMASQRKSSIAARLVEGSAEAIPMEDGSVDTVVTTWTLCTIADVRAALAEVRRVLKPEGRLLLVEHGLAPQEKVRKWQHRLTPAWKRIAGGCHLDRPIDQLVEGAGFRIVRMETGYLQGPKAMTFMYEGIAAPD
jgi:SAM-dependent methyltransferase